MNNYFGKYRGEVTNNIDPEGRGRVQVSVPSVLGSGRMSWATPCVPFAGPQQGFFAVPPIGANVWVEFEEGDLDSPIWVGGFWGTGECPANPALPQTLMIATQTVTLAFDSILQQAELKIEGVGSVLISPTGVEVSNGSGAVIKLSGPAVSINNGALDVM